MQPFQLLDARFGAMFPTVGGCCSIAIPDIMGALGDNDARRALATFQSWCQARGLIAVQLTFDFMMVGRHLAA